MTPTITLPCGHQLPEADLLRLAGQITGKRRQGKPAGRNGGRPLSANRCPCGAMTISRAASRNHKCEGQYPRANPSLLS